MGSARAAAHTGLFMGSRDRFRRPQRQPSALVRHRPRTLTQSCEARTTLGGPQLGNVHRPVTILKGLWGHDCMDVIGCWVGRKLQASVCKGPVTGCLYSIITQHQSRFQALACPLVRDYPQSSGSMGCTWSGPEASQPTGLRQQVLADLSASKADKT